MKNKSRPSKTKFFLRKDNTSPGKNYKYFILALGCLSAMIVMAIPNTSLSILMPDISDELDLSIAQVGVIWGIGSFPAMFSGLFAGALGDKLGLKWMAIIACLLIGVVRILQGFASGFIALTLTIILTGLISPFLLINMINVLALWFPEDERSTATGLFSAGMAVGFLIGSMLSGTVLAPWLGGWRNVFIFYGILSNLLIIPWVLSRPHSPLEAEIKSEETSDSKSIFTGLLHVIKIPEIWYIGLAGLFISGSIYALLGYLPLHLEGLGWEETIADGAVSLIYLIGLIAVLPLSSWAERAGKQNLIMIILTCIAITSFIFFSFARGFFIWIAIILLGLVRNAYMSITTAVMLKSKRLNFNYLGSASSFRMILLYIGYLFAPMIGNKLAETSPNTPFLFWAIFACIGIVFLFLIPSIKPNSDAN